MITTFYFIGSFRKFYYLLPLILVVDINCDMSYHSGNTLRFPRARDEPPHSQRTLAVGSHRLRFPAGDFVYLLRWFCALQLHLFIALLNQTIVIYFCDG